MAQGDFWQFGVAYPLKNHKFRHPSRITSTCVAIAYLGEGLNTTVILSAGSYTQVSKYIQRGDYLVIGTSTSEVHKIASVSGSSQTTIQLLGSSLSRAFSDGETVVLYGTKLAGGWTIDDDSNQIDPLGNMPLERGASDSYAQVLQQSITSNGVPQQNGEEWIRQTLDANLLLPQTGYRFGCMYRTDIDSNTNASIKVQFNDSSQSQKRIIRQASQGDVLSWTRWENIFYCINTAGSQTPELSLGIDAVVPSRVFMMTDDLFLEHARNISYATARIKNAQSTGGTNYSVTVYESSVSTWDDFSKTIVFIKAPDGTYAMGQIFNVGSSNDLIVNFLNIGSTSAFQRHAEIQLINDGYYQLQDYPIQSSLSYERVSATSILPTEHGSGILYNRNGIADRSERWFLTAQFRAVSQSIYDELKKFIWYQEQGNLINIHPFIDDLPHVMTGRMQIKNFSKVGTPFLSTVDFTIEFEEVLI